MSYLENKDDVSSFTQAIISFWFRVPSETLDAIEYDGEADPSPVFNGIIPLLVMGEEGREEGKYDDNAKVVLWFTSTFVSQGPHYSTSAEFMGSECTETFTFSLAGIVTECCATRVSTTMYTATQISPDPPPGEGEEDPNVKKEYKPVYSPEPHPDQPSNPTCIGVDADGYLYVNFQTNQQPTVTGRGEVEYVTSITAGESTSYSGNIGYSSGAQVTTVNYYHNALGCVGLAESSTVEGPTVVEGFSGSGTGKEPKEEKSTFPPLPPATGKFSSGGYEIGWPNKIEVSPDRWHHVLVSVELKPTKTHSVPNTEEDPGFDDGSLLYVALDDVNYTKDDLNGGWMEGRPENEVYPFAAWDVATDQYNPDSDPPGVQETYELSDPTVPRGPIGIPAPSKYEDNVRQVEMADLQIWFGQSIDTGDEQKRRLFIDDEGKPVKPTVAEDELGPPDILLRGSGNWKRGVIKGTLAPDPVEPWFTPTPTPEEDGIVRWTPDPTLHGPQSPR